MSLNSWHACPGPIKDARLWAATTDSEVRRSGKTITTSVVFAYQSASVGAYAGVLKVLRRTNTKKIQKIRSWRSPTDESRPRCYGLHQAFHGSNIFLTGRGQISSETTAYHNTQFLSLCDIDKLSLAFFKSSTDRGLT